MDGHKHVLMQDEAPPVENVFAGHAVQLLALLPE